MAKIKLYLNEDIHIDFARALRKEGYDVISTQEIGKKSAPDDEQLDIAIKEERAVLTFNVKDYVKLHSSYIREGKSHYGIIASTQLPIKEVLKRILKLLSSLSAEDMINRLEYLNSWK